MRRLQWREKSKKVSASEGPVLNSWRRSFAFTIPSPPSGAMSWLRVGVGVGSGVQEEVGVWLGEEVGVGVGVGSGVEEEVGVLLGNHVAVGVSVGGAMVSTRNRNSPALQIPVARS